MTLTYSHEMQQQLKDTLNLLEGTLGTNLLGVYLYGSSLVGGLQKYSDLDLFVVINRGTTLEQKKKLVKELLQISGIYMKESKLPLEVTLVEKSKINPWQYPPYFDFQYGEWLRQSFENGFIEPWPTYEMPDLAVIITQVLLSSQTLWGLEPEKLLQPVPYHDFMKAMLEDLDRLAMDLESDTRNVLLTYARIWSTLATNAIRSKPAATDWVMNHLPEEHHPVMKRAKSICVGLENEHWDDLRALIKPCAEFMRDKIHAQAARIDFTDLNNSISLAEDSSPSNWEVYLIQTKSGKLYTGITTDLTRRLAEHQRGKKGARFFRLSPADSIVYREKCLNRSEATKRENAIKKMNRNQKLALIKTC